MIYEQELKKWLEIADDVVDSIIDEIDSAYSEMEKRKGVYEFTGEHKATWINRMTVLFEADGFYVRKLDDEKIMVLNKY